MTSGSPPIRKRRAEGRFNRFVQDQPSVPGKLPPVHITRAYALDDMLDGEGLEPKYCDVFGEELIYLFYGRPAYRAKEGNNARLEFEWPIIFIFDQEKISTVKRVFPFDTGAFAIGLYQEFFDKRSMLLDFAVEPSFESVSKLIGAFYRDHVEYYRGISLRNVDLHRQFEAQGVHELSRLPGVQGAKSMWRERDERSSAIEIQVAAPINFRDALVGIILPQPYMDDDEIKAALVRWDVKEIETYETLHNMGGDAWVGMIYEIVRRLCQRLGYLP